MTPHSALIVIKGNFPMSTDQTSDWEILLGQISDHALKEHITSKIGVAAFMIRLELGLKLLADIIHWSKRLGYLCRVIFFNSEPGWIVT